MHIFKHNTSAYQEHQTSVTRLVAVFTFLAPPALSHRWRRLSPCLDCMDESLKSTSTVHMPFEQLSTCVFCLLQILLWSTRLQATKLFLNIATSPLSAMQQVTHPLTSYGLKTKIVPFSIRGTLLLLGMLQEILMGNDISAPQRTMSLKMLIHMRWLLCYVSIVSNNDSTSTS